MNWTRVAAVGLVAACAWAAAFIPLPAMPERHTFDGIHLNAAGYEVWDQAILAGIEAALCKSS